MFSSVKEGYLYCVRLLDVYHGLIIIAAIYRGLLCARHCAKLGFIFLFDTPMGSLIPEVP